MKILNPEIEALINALPEGKKKQKELLKRLLEFENEHSDKATYAFKSEILDMLYQVTRDKK